MNKQKKRSFSFSNFLWDIGCLISVVGIWPRFIEPRLLSTTKMTLTLPNLPPAFDNLVVAQFSDLHFSASFPDFLLRKLKKKILDSDPHLIVFTGDLLSYASLTDPQRLKNFLKALHAPYGCFAVLGNHDYFKHVTINRKGEYDISSKQTSEILKRLKLLFTKINPCGAVHTRLKNATPHPELKALFETTPFTLLENETVVLSNKKEHFNICGLGEHMAGHSLANKAFEKYDRRFPGMILAHNPDSLLSLKKYPGEVILCGHTHGIQINFPWIRKKTVLMESSLLKRGLIKIDNKWVYVNRGIGSTFPFRLFSRPELLILTLKRA